MQTQKPKKRIKILYLITKSVWGGAGRYVYDLATFLPKETYDIAVVLGGEGELKSRLEQTGIRVISIPSLQRDVDLKKELLSFKELFYILKNERPDILHTNSSKAGFLGAVVGRIYSPIKLKIIFTAHGWAFNEKRSALSRFIIACLHWKTVFLSTKTIAVSEMTKKQIANFPFLKNKLVTIYNGISSSNILDRDTARNELLPNIKFLPDTLWIGTVSELHSNKGLDFAIETFSILKTQIGLPPFIFVVIGEGEERIMLEKHIKEDGLKNTVFLVGNKKDAARLLKAFDIFTLTSRTEALPYAILEAGSAGLPVIASNVGGIKEIIPSENLGILIESGNIIQIAESIKKLLQDSAKRNMLAKNLQEHILCNFSIQKMVEETTKLYQTLFNK